MRRLSTSAVIAFAALGLATSPMAWGQQDHPDDKDHPTEQHPEAHAAPGVARPPVDQHVVKRDETVRTNETVTNRTNTTVVQGGGGAGRWHSGDRFTGSRVVFQDWGRYHLEAPPSGYEWVQDGDELILINLNTGLVSSIFLIP